MSEVGGGTPAEGRSGGLLQLDIRFGLVIGRGAVSKQRWNLSFSPVFSRPYGVAAAGGRCRPGGPCVRGMTVYSRFVTQRTF